MFNCEVCKRPSYKMERIVVEKRNTTYYYTVIRKKRTGSIKILNYMLSEEEISNYKKEGFEVFKKAPSKGTEIVKEIKVCRNCSKKLQSNQ